MTHDGEDMITKRLMLLVLVLLTACGGAKTTRPAEEAALTEQQPADPAPASTADEPANSPQTAPSDVLPNDGTRAVGDVTKCPVSGDVFEITADTAAVEHDGGTYYLCCKGCVKDFQADPASYLSAPPDEPAESQGSGGHHHHHHHDHEH